MGLELDRRARTSRGEIAFTVVGEGPPVVLVHGTPSRGLVWREVAPDLAREHRLPVEVSERIAAAIPGARRVVVPVAGHFSMVDQPKAKDLLSLLKQIGPRALAVGGCARGRDVAASAARAKKVARNLGAVAG